MLQQLISLGSPRRFYHFCGLLFPWCFTLSLMILGYGTVSGLFFAPADYLQGDGFRIIYVHVPCAIFSLVIYLAMAFLSAIFLIWRIKIAQLVASTLAPIGAFFTFCALVTGAIWGKPMWGTWWIWDARLTSELILLFLYCGYIGLNQAIIEPKKAAKSCAVLALIGAIDIPIIHYSVYWWSTLHQGATISRFTKPAIDGTMLWPLLAMILGMGLYVVAILCVRIRTEILLRGFNHQWVLALLKKRG